MKLSVLVLAAAFVSCNPRGVPASQTAYAPDVEAVRSAWAEDPTLPEDACREPYIAFVELPACMPGVLCTRSWFSASRRRDVLVIRNDLPPWETRQAVLHEAVHWLSSCTTHEDTWVSDELGWAWTRGDAYHRDPRLWAAYGVLARAQP